jgi:hypothetical protein
MDGVTQPVTAAYLYPWDVAGDPHAAQRLAALGLVEVTLAAVYHATRAVTPHHPRHRIVTAERTAAYVPLNDSRWRRAPIALSAADDSFLDAAQMLRASGLDVHAWVVFTHVDRPGDDQRFNVVNAYGDRYPWALCPANDEVVSYATAVADEVTELDGLAGIELEACGWYGVDHMCAHDKATLPGSADGRYLLSLCFCRACVAAFTVAGVDGDRLRRDVRDALDGPPHGTDTDDASGINLLDDRAQTVASVRRAMAERFRAAVIERIRARRPEWRVALHASPNPTATTAFTGIDMDARHHGRHPTTPDALVVNCWNGHGSVAASLGAGIPVHANVLAVAELGGDPYTLIDRGQAAVRAGATGVRLYHAGLAGDRDRSAMRSLIAALRSAESPLCQPHESQPSDPSIG